jgi:hypothetical protein
MVGALNVDQNAAPERHLGWPSARLLCANSGPHAAAEWIIGIQHNSGATEAWVWAIDNVMLLLHPGVV